jgi:hypothetical protein
MACMAGVSGVLLRAGRGSVRRGRPVPRMPRMGVVAGCRLARCGRMPGMTGVPVVARRGGARGGRVAGRVPGCGTRRRSAMRCMCIVRVVAGVIHRSMLSVGIRVRSVRVRSRRIHGHGVLRRSVCRVVLGIMPIGGAAGRERPARERGDSKASKHHHSTHFSSEARPQGCGVT